MPLYGEHIPQIVGNCGSFLKINTPVLSNRMRVINYQPSSPPAREYPRGVTRNNCIPVGLGTFAINYFRKKKKIVRYRMGYYWGGLHAAHFRESM